MGRPAIDHLARLPIDSAEVSFGQAIESQQEPASCRRHPEALEQQVVEAEGEVEGRIAEPRAFGIDENRALWPNQDVLWTDIVGVADEGGWWPEFASNAEALDTLVEAIERAA